MDEQFDDDANEEIDWDSDGKEMDEEMSQIWRLFVG